MRDEAIGYVARVKGSEQHGEDADEAKEADRERGVVVGRAGKEEGECRPEGGKSCGHEDRRETCLDQKRMSAYYLRDGIQKAGVRESLIGRRVVGHEEPEEDEDCILQAERHPVDCAPGGEVRDGT